ncbi:MAG TPA: hypothetical protein VGP66_11915, partial [Candidatus Acidoferrum sp.]|nr:hypothetical protein [Candidatus Acidoferrum sp.]
GTTTITNIATTITTKQILYFNPKCRARRPALFVSCYLIAGLPIISPPFTPWMAEIRAFSLFSAPYKSPKPFIQTSV